MWDILVVDKSASMIHNIEDIKKGFNELIKEQTEQESKNRFTVIAFNTDVEIISDDIFTKTPDVIDKLTNVKGLTALLDAIGKAYSLILKQTEIKDITLTVITDGQENSSRHYTIYELDDLKKDIDKDYNLNMTFIGADKDCLYGNPISLHANLSVSCEGNLLGAMRTASSSMSSQRDGTDYTPEGVVNITSLDINYKCTVKTPIMKRSSNQYSDDSSCCIFFKKPKVSKKGFNTST
tara:strand:- start:7571 stop:8281 length:711 start_codon:yes stop_codon:yes gene_type:complete